MKLKDKIRTCIQILFKGRDIDKELEGKEQKVQEELSKVKKRLEFLLDSSYPSAIADANRVSLAMTSIPVCEFSISTSPHIHYPHLSSSMETIYKKLMEVEGKYVISESPEEISDKIGYIQRIASRELAEILLSEKLLHTEIMRGQGSPTSFILRVTANIYKG